jgi:ankyrin repeat protein
MNRRILFTLIAILLSCIVGRTLAASKSPIADAAQRGDRTAAQTLLAQKVDPNLPQADGATALHWAVHRNDLAMADMLLRAGAKPNATNRSGISPLYMASLYGSPAMIDKLLKAGGDAKGKGPTGETLLMLAARSGSPEAIKLLLTGGAEVNAKESTRGTTALMWAAEQKHPAAVKALLAGGADFSIRSRDAGNPRNYMSSTVGNSRGGELTARLRLCIAQNGGPSIEEQARQGGGRGGLVGPSEGPCAGIVPTRGGGGGRRNQQQGQQPAPTAPEDDEAEDAGPVAGLVGSGGGGLTALILAAREGDLETTRLLLDAGADVNQRSYAGWTPLLIATNNRNYQLAKFLVERDADVNIPSLRVSPGRPAVPNFTPLYLATDNRNIEGGDYPVPKPDMDHLDFIRILLGHGADPNARISDNTATRTIFTMQWFFEDGATPFVRAAQSGDTVLMKLLLDRGADPKLATNAGDTALAAAAGIGWVEGVTYEWSPKENLEAVKMLLDLGLDPNSSNVDGRTPLMGAALKGRKEVVQLLVDRGAKLDTRDKGSRDTVNANAVMAGHTWQAVDYADGLVRVGVQSAVAYPEVGALLRKLMRERGMKPPDENRTIDSICIVEICRERQPEFLNP